MVFIANFETDFSGKFLTDNLTIFAGENLPFAESPFRTLSYFQRAVLTRETLFQSVEKFEEIITERLKSVSTQHFYEPFCISA